ncbi:uncharacterized protein LOC133327604 [Musca vetustissima]|uniref:uncharacterized protein LOC133327604 n=1 Tax=Musca vetustissima TaxID=27455 RepID=UPI002AB6D781|nr:uncharacterized protein LOC133327604 [Musca vetustissima]
MYPAYSPGLGSRPRLQSLHPFRQLISAGSHPNGAWTGGGGGSGHSGYGPEPPEYDYHSGPPAPSGGSYSYHSTAGTGYGVPPPAPHPHPNPHPHPPVHPPTGGTGYGYGGGGGGGKKKGGGGGGGGKKGKRGSSTITALTLLSCLFLVNLLQGCIKDHMDSMNPTVMVMTTDIRRSSLNKMGDMNSREQGSSAGVVASGGANLVMQPADMLASAALNSASVMEAMKPYVNLQSPYSGVMTKPLDVMASQPHQQPPPAPGTVVTHYQPQSVEQPQVSYAPRPPFYDQQHQPDVYEPRPSYGAPVPQYGPPSQSNYSPRPSNNEPPPPSYQQNQQPPIYMGSPMDQPQLQHGYGNNDYSPPPPPPQQPSSYSTPRNPFYDPPNPSYHNSYKGVYTASQHSPDNGYQKYPAQKYPQKYQEEEALPGDSYHHHQGPVPWSSSQSSSSVVSGPIRRATIVSISPTIKWVSVPSNVDDHTDFDQHAEEADEIRRSSRYDEISFNDKP